MSATSTNVLLPQVTVTVHRLSRIRIRAGTALSRSLSTRARERTGIVSPYPDPSWAMWFEHLQLAYSSQQRRLLGSLPGLTTALQNHLIRENLFRVLHPTHSHKEDLNRSRNSQEPLHIMVTCCSRATCCDLSLLRLRRASRTPHAGVLLARSKNGTGRVTGPLVSGYKRQHVQLRKESRSAAEPGIATVARVVTSLSPRGLLVLLRLSGGKQRRSRAPVGLRSRPGTTSAARRSPGNSEASRHHRNRCRRGVHSG
jgi:hypothetical protein